MSTYFQSVPYVPYRFGESESYVLHQNITHYADIVDQVRDHSSFYQKYTIRDGDRPDNVSQLLYKSPKYYWTFYLMNDHLRKNGWPLTNTQVYEFVQKEKPNTVITTRSDIANSFIVGEEISGLSSGETATIISRNLDLGQLTVQGTKNFYDGETIRVTVDEVLYSAVVNGSSEEYNAIYQYTDEDGVPVDINPFNGPGAELAAVSHYDRYFRENEALKDIIVMKPDIIDAIFTQFQEAMSR